MRIFGAQFVSLSEGSDNFEGIYGLIGSAFNDTLTGTGLASVLYGGAGDDFFKDASAIFGGDGIDTVNFGDLSYKVFIRMAGINANVFDVELMLGTSFSDKIYGDDLSNTVNGNGGDDELRGLLGDDLLYGNVGNDQLFGDGGNDQLFGSLGNDSLTGGYGDDILLGSTGADTLNGDGGNDHLSGGKGNDSLIGGSGADTFVYARGDGHDAIRTFQNGSDVINITSGATSFADVTVSQQGADTLVEFSNVTILLYGIDFLSITAADFTFG